MTISTESKMFIDVSSPTKSPANSRRKGKKYSPSSFKKMYSTPSSSKKVQKWSPRGSWGGGHRGHKVFSPNSPRSSKSHSQNRDITKNWDFRVLKLNLDTEVFVNNTARMLEENNLFLIKLIVKCVGKEEVVKLMKSTQAVQNLGGLELPISSPKGSYTKPRRRTKRSVGGVFIQLAKQKIPSDQWKMINKQSEKNKPKNYKRRSAMNTPRSSAVNTPRSSRPCTPVSHGKKTSRILFGAESVSEEKSISNVAVSDLNEVFQPVNSNQLQSKATEENIPETIAQKKQVIGECLYSQVLAQVPDYAPKITGMLLEAMDHTSLSKLMSQPDSLKKVVNEALSQYKTAAETERESIGEELYNKVKSKVSPVAQCLTGKITGMLLAMPKQLLSQVLESPDALTSCINNSMWVLQKEKQMLGNRLYPKIRLYTSDAKKVTGMVLELDPTYVETLLKSPHALKVKVEECLSVLGANDLVVNFVSPRTSKKGRKCLSLR